MIAWNSVVRHLKLAYKLRQTGVYYVLCVFHQEKTPSLVLRPNGRYRCYGCRAGGTIEEFIERIGITIVESVSEDPRQLSLPFFEA